MQLYRNPEPLLPVSWSMLPTASRDDVPLQCPDHRRTRRRTGVGVIDTAIRSWVAASRCRSSSRWRPRQSGFHVEISAADVTCAVHDALDTDHAFVFTVEDQIAAMREHADTITQYGPRSANVGRPAEPKAPRFQLVNEAERTDRVVLGDIDSNINQIRFCDR